MIIIISGRASSKPCLFYRSIYVKTGLDIAILVLITIVLLLNWENSRSIIDSNLRNVTKALHVPKGDMCLKCEFKLRNSEMF